MLSKSARRQLKTFYGWSDEDIAVFENPTMRSIRAFVGRVNRESYWHGYHKAIEDLKEIVGNVKKLREIEEKSGQGSQHSPENI